MRIRAKTLIYFQIIYNLIIKYLIQAFHLPSMLNYVSDLVTIFLLLAMLQGRKGGHSRIRQYDPASQKPFIGRHYLFKGLVIAYILWSVFSYIINLYNPVLYLWGIRNNFRYFVFVAACYRYLNKEDIERIFDIFFWFYCVNIVVLSYQILVQNIRYDFASGLFGAGEAMGGVSELNALIVIVVSIYVVKYLTRSAPLWKMIVAVAGALFMAAINELKIVYIEVFIIFALVTLITRFSVKKLTMIGLGTMLMAFSMIYLQSLYPNWAGFFSIDEIVRYSTMGYGSKTAISRIGAVGFVTEHFFHDPLEYIFGIGLGNADYSSNFTFLQSKFYQLHQNTNYHFIQSAFTLVEMGFVGLGLFMAILLSPAMYSMQIKHRTGLSKQDRYLLNIVILISLFAIVMLFYNLALRREGMAYSYFFFFSIPVIVVKEASWRGGETASSLR